ncbi:MAG TPA: hypothetical protein VL527_17660 [Dongiaceae bacterium]|nr:hypothetical protein [Dongiaceae bacterium]
MQNPSTKNLLLRAIGFGIFNQLFLLLFLLAPGGMDYWQGWAFVVVNLVATTIFIGYYYRHDRELLARRLLRKETVFTQKFIMFVLQRVAVLFYLVCALDHRFGWSRQRLAPLPGWLSILALLAYGGGFLLNIPVLNANRFAASVIQVESGQVLADQGAYRWVRHP